MGFIALVGFILIIGLVALGILLFALVANENSNEHYPIHTMPRKKKKKDSIAKTNRDIRRRGRRGRNR